MIVLALDTSGGDCAACIYDSANDAVLGKVCETIGKGHAERLMGIVDKTLEEAKLDLKAVERIAVTIGPGSFTGIRVGVSAARGFALSLGVEAVGLTTLEVMAKDWQDQHGQKPVTIGLDARRGEVYIQSFAADGSPVTHAELLPVEDAVSQFSRLGGDVFGSASILLNGEVSAVEPDRFEITAVARLGAAKPQGGPRPAPLYLRGPDARPQTGFALERRAHA
jgi:tRNA threonylcarbamoyladenosine biosynthesis protein TsaB